MKARLIALVGLLLAANGWAQVFVDHFNYAAGNLGTTGGTGGWSGSNVGVTITSNSLDGTGLGLAPSSGNKVTTTTGSSSGTYNQFSAGIATGTVYHSFLLRVNSTSGLDATGEVISGLLRNGSASSYYQDVWLRLNGSNVEIGLSKLRAGTTWHTTPLTVGATYLVVTKYQFVTGSNNDIVSLWLNPATGGTNEPAADISISAGSDGNTSIGIGRCYIYGGYAADIDEVRVGTSWADVTPSEGGPPPPPPPTPVISQAFMNEFGFNLAGYNGLTNGEYDVVASSTLDVPAAQWPVIGTDSFDGNGLFNFIDGDAAGAPQKFYRIRVHDPNAPVPPSILVQPQDTTNTVGDTATLSVSASGTAPLYYRWFFNLTTPVTNGTSAVLTLANVQTNQSGGYSVLVSNVAGSVTSIVAQLVVTNVVAPPSILAHPQNQSVVVGQTVNFSVTAAGTQPLFYQWYFEDVSPLLDATNPVLTLTGVTTNDAGNYSVVVSNGYGTATSSNATLTVSTNAPPDFGPVGFCNVGGTITGGAAGPVVYAGSEAQLQAYSDVNPPYTIYITNSFTLSGMSTHIRSNKTVIGVGNIVLSGGGLYLYRSGNVIIRNLTIQNSSEDGIGLHYSGKVWIDHCTIKNSNDGGIDITQSSDNVTISWCKFIYDANYGHNFVSLIAANDADNGSQYHVTYHHNWWSTNCVERMPSVRFGRVHVFNNYYNSSQAAYCVRTRIDAQVLVENNFFEGVKNPWERYVTSGTPGLLRASGNNVGYLDTSYGVTWAASGSSVLIPGTDDVFTPPYSYSLDNALDAKNIVIENAGAGKGPFAP
jgi:pectate lyase